MAKKNKLEDRLLSREEALLELKKLISSPEILMLSNTCAIQSKGTAKAVAEALIYADANREYLKSMLPEIIRLRLLVLAQLYQTYYTAGAN